jgi:hypothetical protein
MRAKIARSRDDRLTRPLSPKSASVVPSSTSGINAASSTPASTRSCFSRHSFQSMASSTVRSFHDLNEDLVEREIQDIDGVPSLVNEPLGDPLVEICHRQHGMMRPRMNGDASSRGMREHDGDRLGSCATADA